MPLICMPRIASATCSASSSEDGELHAAGLAAAADEHLGLDHDLRRVPGAVEQAGGGGARLGGGAGDLPRRARAGPGASRSFLASASWIFTGRRWYRSGRLGAVRRRRQWIRRASPIRSSAAGVFAERPDDRVREAERLRARRTGRRGPRRRRRCCGASSPRSPGSRTRMPTVRRIAPRSRPTASQAASRSARRSRTDVVDAAEPGGVPGVGPRARSGRSIRSPFEATRIGGWRSGGGSSCAPLVAAPAARRGRPSRRAGGGAMTSRSSSNRPTRWSNG